MRHDDEQGYPLVGGRVHVRPESSSINTATHLLTGHSHHLLKLVAKYIIHQPRQWIGFGCSFFKLLLPFFVTQIQPHFVVDFSLFPEHFFELLHRIFHCVGISGDIWRNLSKIGEEDTTTMLRCTLHRQLKLSQAQKRRKQLMQGPDTTRTRQGKTPSMQHA